MESRHLEKSYSKHAIQCKQEPEKFNRETAIKQKTLKTLKCFECSFMQFCVEETA